MITVYGINNCDTIRKTRQLLIGSGVEFNFHDYKKLGCSEALIHQFLQHFELEQLINTRGTSWRKLPDSVKHKLTDIAAIKLMSEETSIIKRPIIEINGRWLLGFDKAKIQHLVLD